MPKAIYLNLMVNDLPKTQEFFRSMGLGFDDSYSDEQAVALVIAENFYAMLHTGESIARFSKKTFIANRQQSEVLISMQVDSREEVDRLMEKALEGGATEHRVSEDHGFMYIRCFEDLDGHIWEPFWMGEEEGEEDEGEDEDGGEE